MLGLSPPPPPKICYDADPTSITPDAPARVARARREHRQRRAPTGAAEQVSKVVVPPADLAAGVAAVDCGISKTHALTWLKGMGITPEGDVWVDDEESENEDSPALSTDPSNTP